MVNASVGPSLTVLFTGGAGHSREESVRRHKHEVRSESPSLLQGATQAPTEEHMGQVNSAQW